MLPADGQPPPPGGTSLGNGWFVIDREDLPDFESHRANTPRFAIIEPETVFTLFGGESEPKFGDQWYLENTGQEGGTPGADVSAVDAWSLTSGGPSVVVAIVDSGMDLDHPDLVDRLWQNPGEPSEDGLDSDGNRFVDDIHGWDFVDSDNKPDDTNGHGTQVAGVLAASVNGVGIAGIAAGISIMPLRACAPDCDAAPLISAINYAVANGADVINLSLGSKPGDPVSSALQQSIDDAAAAGVTVVAAVGNDSVDIDSEPVYPASFPSVIAVSATDRNDALSTFSNYGSSSVDLAAPGEDILTTGINGDVTVSGTSFSAPLTAGTSALMLTCDPTLAHTEIQERLRSTADTVGDLASTSISGGRLNAAAAAPHVFCDIYRSIFITEITWLREVGITKGCNPPDNNLFCPTGNVSRGQMAAFLARALALPAASKDYFDDDTESVFQDDINKIAEANITKGCNPPDNDLFCPDGKVTREQMAAFLARALGLPDASMDYFTDDASSIFEDDINRIAEANITDGCNPPDNDNFCPSNVITREQMAKFLQRAFG